MHTHAHITLLSYNIPSNLCCCLKRDQVISNEQVIVCGIPLRDKLHKSVFLYDICSSGSASFASCLPHNAYFTLGILPFHPPPPQQTWQTLQIQFEPQKLKIFLRGGVAKKNASFWRCMQFPFEKAWHHWRAAWKNKHGWFMHGGTSFPATVEPAWNVACTEGRQEKALLQLEGNKNKPLDVLGTTNVDVTRWGGGDAWGHPHRGLFCQLWMAQHSGQSGEVHPSCLCQGPALMDDPARGGVPVRWQGPINKQIVALRSFVCHQEEVLFFIISVPQIINTHKPNDAWLLLQSLPH